MRVRIIGPILFAVLVSSAPALPQDASTLSRTFVMTGTAIEQPESEMEQVAEFNQSTRWVPFTTCPSYLYLWPDLPHKIYSHGCARDRDYFWLSPPYTVSQEYAPEIRTSWAPETQVEGGSALVSGMKQSAQAGKLFDCVDATCQTWTNIRLVADGEPAAGIAKCTAFAFGDQYSVPYRCYTVVIFKEEGALVRVIGGISAVPLSAGSQPTPVSSRPVTLDPVTLHVESTASHQDILNATMAALNAKPLEIDARFFPSPLNRAQIVGLATARRSSIIAGLNEYLSIQVSWAGEGPGVFLLELWPGVMVTEMNTADLTKYHGPDSSELTQYNKAFLRALAAQIGAQICHGQIADNTGIDTIQCKH